MKLAVLLFASLPALAQVFPASGLQSYGWCSELTNCKQLAMYTLNIGTGTVDMKIANAGGSYTPPVGKRAVVMRWRLWQNGNAPTCTPHIKLGGTTDVQIGGSITVTAGTGTVQLLTPFALEHNDIFALNCSVAGVNVHVDAYEFDAGANAPFTKYLNMTSGTGGTILTVSPGRVLIPLLEIGTTATVASNNLCTFMNTTGSSIGVNSLNVDYVPVGQTSGLAYRVYTNSGALSNGIRADMIGVPLNAGDFVFLSTPTVAANSQFMWCTGIEMPQ